MSIHNVSNGYGFPCLDPACKVRIVPRDPSSIDSLHEAREIRDAHVAEIHPEIKFGAALLSKAEYVRRKMAAARAARKGHDDIGIEDAHP